MKTRYHDNRPKYAICTEFVVKAVENTLEKAIHYTVGSTSKEGFDEDTPWYNDEILQKNLKSCMLYIGRTKMRL